MSHQYKNLEATVYFWFASNDTSGSGDDGASPVYDVRLAGAAAEAIPTLSGSATLLSHANYPAGCHEIAVAATAANGFSANAEYAVFCTLLVDSQNPSGFVGSFVLSPVLANMTQLGSDAQSATDLKDFSDAGYDPSSNKVQGVVLTDTCTANSDLVSANNVRDAILDDATRFSGANIDAAISGRAVAGDNMNLADNAITSAKYDESTAFPVASVDSGSTEIARTGADSDTLETLSDQIDGTSTHTAANVWTVGSRTLTSFGTLVADIATAVWGAVTRTLTSGGDATEAKQNTIIADIAAQNDVSTAQVQSSCDSAVTANATIVAINAKTANLPSGIKKNVALNDFIVEMVLASDHITPATGLTVTCQILKDGAAYVNSSNTVTEVSAGSYKISFTQAEMNYGILAWKFTAPTADQKVVVVITSA